MKRIPVFILAFLLLNPVSKVFGEKKVDESEGKLEKATFAGGCFWCMEPPYEKLPGVKSVISGYIGGKEENPTYEEVSSGRTGHAEAVEVTFDSSVLTYKDLLYVFWRNINPTTIDGQFADRGAHYRTGIFYHDEEQKKLALASKEELRKSGKFDKPIVTEVTPASKFYPAEDYHQDYYKKNPADYKRYRFGSGRETYLKETWSGDS